MLMRLVSSLAYVSRTPEAYPGSTQSYIHQAQISLYTEKNAHSALIRLYSPPALS